MVQKTKRIPLTLHRLNDHHWTTRTALQDNLNGFLDRAAAIAALLADMNPDTIGLVVDERRQRHPIQEAAYAIWLELQDAKTYIRDFHNVVDKKSMRSA